MFPLGSVSSSASSRSPGDRGLQVSLLGAPTKKSLPHILVPKNGLTLGQLILPILLALSKEGATPRSLSPFPCASKPGIPSLLRKKGQWETDVGIVGSILQNGSQLPSWCVIRAGPAPPLQETAGSCCWVLGPAPRLVGREQSLQLDTPAT